MLPLLLGAGLSAAFVGSGTAPGDAVIRSLDERLEQRPPAERRRSRDERRPAGRQLEMGPAATGLAMLALVAAVVVRRRQTATR